MKFLLQSKSEQSNIYVQLSINRKNVFKRKTGYIINSKYWSASKGQPILNDEVLKNLKTSLDKFKTKLEEAYNDANRKGLIIDAVWLQEQIDIINNKKPIVELDILTNYTQDFIDNAHTRPNQKGGTGLSVNRIKSIKTFLRFAKEYQTEIKKQILIKDVSPLFAKNFMKWLYSKDYMTNYVGKNLSILRTMCNDADENDIEVHPKARFIKIVKEEPKKEDIITLSFDELDKIMRAPILNEAYINARKWLAIGCSIGQRGTDLLSITEANIQTEKDFRYIKLIQQKTGKEIKAAIFPEIEKIISTGLPYKISLQKFNDRLKDICEIAKIDQPTKGKIRDKKTNLNVIGIYPKYKLISSHVCRRSFATNYYGGEITTPALINITGHSTERMFLQYIGESGQDTVKQMFDIVSKKQPRKPQPQMKIIKSAK